jgi:hypothetical protein
MTALSEQETALLPVVQHLWDGLSEAKPIMGRISK